MWAFIGASAPLKRLERPERGGTPGKALLGAEGREEEAPHQQAVQGQRGTHREPLRRFQTQTPFKSFQKTAYLNEVILYYIGLYYIILYYIILYHIILYYITLYYIILYFI